MLEQLSPGQRQAVMYGLPVVAVFAFLAVRSKKAAAAPATSTTPISLPSQAVLGASQLAEFEQAMTDSYNSLAATVSSALLNAPAPAAAPPPASTVPPDAPVPITPPPLAPAPTPTAVPVYAQTAAEQFAVLTGMQGGVAPQLNGAAIAPSGTGPHAAMAGEYPVIYG